MKELRFEEYLEKLQATVEQLEAGDIELEKALDLFQTGTSLAIECKKKLSQAELKIETLSKKLDSPLTSGADGE